MTSPGLVLEEIVKHFGSHIAVNHASLRTKKGEIVALLGPSGCGKTTTLRLIAGFETLEAGRIAIEGADIVNVPPFQRNIGLVFQDYALFPHMTAGQNIEYGMRLRGMARTEQKKRRSELLRLVRLEGMEDRRPAALSGGQQQRIAIARALAISPKLLLLDEPLSNLDAKLREALRVDLREILRAVGTTTMVVTHDQVEAMSIADRIAVMDHGRIVQVGTPREIYDEPNTRFVAEFVGQSLWFSGRFEPDEGHARFVTDDGVVFVAQRPAAAAAACYGLSIRPEHVHIRSRPEDINRMSAVVERVDFLGAEHIVRCRLDASNKAMAIPIRSDEQASVGPGDRIELGVSPVHCRIVVDDSVLDGSA
jgi:ABC-type Fe3+/spermidine/putrescine transport system ATPase subunit